MNVGGDVGYQVTDAYMWDERIMIVEDETLIALDIENRLISAGYNVVAAAHGGEEAIRLALIHRPDLMLMDINLGNGPDGIDVFEEVSNYIDTEVIFITAYDDHHSRDRAISIKPAGYLTKPVKGSDLYAAVELAMVKHRSKSSENIKIKSEDFFYRLFNDINNGVFFHGYDDEGMPSSFIEVNEGAVSLLNIPYNDVLQKKPQEIFDYGDEGLFGNMQRIGSFTAEALLLLEQGENIPVEISNCMIEMNDTNLTMSICRIISGRNINEEKMKKSGEEQASPTWDLRSTYEDPEENPGQIRENDHYHRDPVD